MDGKQDYDLQGNEFDMKGLREFQSLLKGSKMKGKRKKTEIRFQGFNEAWEQRKLGEFGKATKYQKIYVRKDVCLSRGRNRFGENYFISWHS